MKHHITQEAVTQEVKQKALIIDKKGVLGASLLTTLQQDFSVVFVSEKTPQTKEPYLAVSYKKRIPKIPNYYYAYIFVVQNEKAEVVDFLFDIVKKAKRDKAVCVIGMSLLTYDKAELERLKNYARGIRIVLFGDIFGPETIAKGKTPVNAMLLQATTTGKLTLANNGLYPLYPVSAEDVLHALLEASFQTENTQLFFCFQQYPPTQLSFARTLQKINPAITPDFINNSSYDVVTVPSFAEGKCVLNAEHSLVKKLSFLKLQEQQFVTSAKEEVHEKKKSTQQAKKPGFPFFHQLFYILFLFLVLPFFSTVLLAFLGAWQLHEVKNSLHQGSITQAKTRAQAAEGFFGLSELTSRVLLAQLDFVNQKTAASRVVQSIHQGQDLSHLIAEGLDAVEKAERVLSGKSTNAKEEFSQALNTLKSAMMTLQQKNVEEKDFFGVNALVAKEAKQLAPTMQLATSISDALPALIGIDGKKTYAVLFQNNMELRPGGGFIGSYGLLSFDHGAFKDFTVHDVYDADGQLKGHIEPPFPVRRYLPSVHWYLRDSNFSLDFRKNASLSAFFLNEELNQKIDGAIAIDVSFVKKIIQALGSVSVPEYKQTVTAENMYMLIQSQVEKDFFPGSTQKKDFLRSLFMALQRRFETNSPLPYLSLLQAFNSGIVEKHVLFAFADQTVQSAFTVNRFSSSLWDNRQESSQHLLDFFGINEANLGINKANYFLERKIKQDMFLSDDGDIQGKVTVTYTNKSKVNEWPGGDYKNYFRIVLPNGTNVTSIAINDQVQDTTPAETNFLLYENSHFKIPKELEVDKSDESGKTIYGLLLTVKAGETKTLSVTYALPKAVALSAPQFVYDLLVLKQPGTDQDPYYFTLSYPDTVQVVTAKKSDWIEAAIDNNNNKVQLMTRLLSDLTLHLTFAHK